MTKAEALGVLVGCRREVSYAQFLAHLAQCAQLARAPLRAAADPAAQARFRRRQWALAAVLAKVSGVYDRLAQAADDAADGAGASAGKGKSGADARVDRLLQASVAHLGGQCQCQCQSGAGLAQGSTARNTQYTNKTNTRSTTY